MKITIAQHDLRSHDVQLYQYSVLPVIILIVTVNGIIAAGMAAAGEFERRTVKELLFAPAGGSPSSRARCWRLPGNVLPRRGHAGLRRSDRPDRPASVTLWLTPSR